MFSTPHIEGYNSIRPLYRTSVVLYKWSRKIKHTVDCVSSVVQIPYEIDCIVVQEAEMIVGECEMDEE